VVNALDPLEARELGLEIHPRGLVYIFPNVGSYLGGDILAGIQFSKMQHTDRLSLLVDVGTKPKWFSEMPNGCWDVPELPARPWKAGWPPWA